MTDDTSQFEAALFVQQLREAGHAETDSACAHFFATDALIRDYEAKGQGDAITSMAEIQLEVHDIWERHFNHQRPSSTADGRIPNLLSLVIDDAAKCDNPPGLYLARAHKKGTTHRLVEHQKAGWVTHWRDVAAEHGRSTVNAGIPSPAPANSVPDPIDTLGPKATTPQPTGAPATKTVGEDTDASNSAEVS